MASASFRRSNSVSEATGADCPPDTGTAVCIVRPGRIDPGWFWVAMASSTSCSLRCARRCSDAVSAQRRSMQRSTLFLRLLNHAVGSVPSLSTIQCLLPLTRKRHAPSRALCCSEKKIPLTCACSGWPAAHRNNGCRCSPLPPWRCWQQAAALRHCWRLSRQS